jgi:hypothetical protein
MSIESEQQAVEHLYKQVRGTEYKPSAFWTTAQSFSPEYKIIKSEFVPETLKQLVPPKGIKPLSPRS